MDMNTKYKKKIRLGLIALGVVAGLLLIGFSILKWAILPSGKLTPLVTNKVNELIDGKLECKSVELTLFETSCGNCFNQRKVDLACGCRFFIVRKQ